MKPEQFIREYGAEKAREEFEKKLTETDIYLQLLIKQVKTLDQKIENVSAEEEKQKLVDIKASLLTLLDCIKHTIVLLQIAKVFIICFDDEMNFGTV